MVVAVIAIWGGYNYPSVTTEVTHEVTNNVGSPTGSTFGTAKQALVVIAPATAAASSTSILNNDASDRMINSIDVACGGLTTSGTSVATFTLKMSTTSVANLGLQGNTNLVGGTITIATATPDIIISSSTPSISTNIMGWDRWAAGTYLTTLVDATQAGVCTVGVKYIPS